MEISLAKGRKHGGKRRKCWLPAFSSFPTMFSKGFFFKVVKSWDGVEKSLQFPKQALVFKFVQYNLYKPFENTVGKGEIAHNEQFLLFPQCFLPVWQTFCDFHQVLNFRLQTFSFEESKIFCQLEKG